MSLVLGIDTGGTYTDGVVVELSEKRVGAKSKALTTREDLAVGIRNCIDDLDLNNFKDIKIVSLSTTLATNAVVEGKGCEVGLILIGHEPVDQLPVRHMAVLPGGHDIKGFPQEDLDLELTRRAIEGFKDKVEAVAISGYLSVRNPEHELKVRDLVWEILKVPVVCAHQLTRSLGFQERTVTAALNARLIPVIDELIGSVKKVLKEKGINASIMIVKGDGSLMGEKVAREKPIETILSGPASSIIGATFLTDTDQALVLDMGGTTTDIAILQEGRPRLNQKGATVGGWLTRVEAAEIYTYGLGGDSYLQVTQEGSLKVGPQRVWPLSNVVHQHPRLLWELKRSLDRGYSFMYAQPTDCFIYLRRPAQGELGESDQEVVNLLKDGPHSIFYLVEQMGVEPILFNLQHLVNLGVIARVSLTPTDLLHAKGVYTRWNVEAAKIGINMMARRLGLTAAEFLEMAEEEVVDNLCLTVVQSLASCEKQKFWIPDNNALLFFIRKALAASDSPFLRCSLGMGMPIVGIGAPVEAWLPRVAEKLHTSLVIPEHAEVANAVGAAVGKIMETVEVLIKPGEGYGQYLVHSSWTCRMFEDLEEATSYAMYEAKRRAAEAAEKAGAKDFELVVDFQPVYACYGLMDQDIFVEAHLEVSAVGRPDWGRR